MCRRYVPRAGHNAQQIASSLRAGTRLPSTAASSGLPRGGMWRLLLPASSVRADAKAVAGEAEIDLSEKVEMKLTEDDYESCREYCFRSWRVRLTPKSSKWIVRDVLDLKVLKPKRTEDEIKGKLVERVREKHPRSWALVWLIVRIVLPIIIQLVLEWWRRRRQEFAKGTREG